MCTAIFNRLPSTCTLILLAILCMSMSPERQSNQNKLKEVGKIPIYNYNFSDSKNPTAFSIEGPSRTLELKGKKGINPTSIHTRLILPKHNLNTSDSGTMVIEVFLLEELNASQGNSNMEHDNKLWRNYPFISDIKEVSQIDSANFGMFFTCGWHPQFYVKMYKGPLWPTRVNPPQKAFVCSEHFSFKANKWYQFAFAWNKTKEQLQFFANGVLIGTSDKNHLAFFIDKINQQLFAGNPVMCYNSISFYDTALEDREINKLYQDNAPDYDPKYDKELRHTFTGKDIHAFNWKLSSSWIEQLNFKMNERELLKNFYIQGYTDAPKVMEEGLLIETPNLPQQANNLEKQVYVWPLKFFEGDLYVEYEFKILRNGGLSLLMTQASGMNREHFMTDYPPRTNGNMNTVTGQGVRNYHWEYYREMNDVRNEIASFALVKNPYNYPLSYGTFDKNLEHNNWHKLQFLQIGSKIIGAIDGKIVVEAEDNADINNGPVLNSGYIAIRCMIKTKLLIRNLKVYNKNPGFKVLE